MIIVATEQSSHVYIADRRKQRFLPIPSFPLVRIISMSRAEIGAYPLVIDLIVAPPSHPYAISFAFSPPTSFTSCSLFRIAA